eukprot:scaffold26209_cov125-Amphora_coffeaeformis.AAC.2
MCWLTEACAGSLKHASRLSTLTEACAGSRKHVLAHGSMCWPTEACAGSRKHFPRNAGSQAR